MTMEMQQVMEVPETEHVKYRAQSVGLSVDIVNENGEVVAVMCGSYEQRQLRGARIVRELNSHDALVEALAEIDKAICNGDLVWNRQRYADGDPYRPAVAKLCAALALVDGPQKG